jgi:iron complex transport system permease protein
MKPHVIRLPNVPISLQIDRRVPLVLLGFSLVTILAMLVSIGQGEYPISILDVAKTILGLETGNPAFTFVIYTLRLPRTLVAFLVGMGLAIAGTITQGITRNPLASPGVLGVNAGAALAAVTLLVVFPAAPVFALPLGAFGGAMLVSTLVYLLAWQGGVAPIRLILVGIGFAAIASALTNLMVALGEINNVGQALVWLAGSVYGRTWEQIANLLPWLIGFGTIALLQASTLNTLNLGDDIARGLGSRVEWQRGILLLTSAALSGACIATAGSIGFVDLMAPHLARQLVGGTHQGLLLTAGLVGGMLVVLSDLVGRLLFAPIELPCGVITAAIGAPYFVYLLLQKRIKK